jgi:ankyrin repeat protein
VPQPLAGGAAPADADPLHVLLGAVMRGDDARIAELLADDPDLPSRMGDGDRELLPIAASGGDDDRVRRLLDLGVPVDAPGMANGSALHYAAWWGRGSTAELLIERGADVHRETHDRGQPGTPLGWAVHGSRWAPGARSRGAGYAEAARALIAAGAHAEPAWAGEAGDAVAPLIEDALSRSARRS